MTKSKKQKMPAWFKGMIYGEGDKVTNNFTGYSYDLNALELSIYDFIIGSQVVIEMAPKSVTTRQINDFKKALAWFQKNNSEAYMVLLD